MEVEGEEEEVLGEEEGEEVSSLVLDFHLPPHFRLYIMGNRIIVTIVY